VHELGVAMEIYRSSRGAVKHCGSGRLRSVRVAVGELASVEPDLLRSAWHAVTQGGPDDGARLAIEWCPARQFCAGCGAEKPHSLGSWLRLCPDCGLPLQVQGGSELDLLQVEFDAEVAS